MNDSTSLKTSNHKKDNLPGNIYILFLLVNIPAFIIAATTALLVFLLSSLCAPLIAWLITAVVFIAVNLITLFGIPLLFPVTMVVTCYSLNKILIMFEADFWGTLMLTIPPM